MKQTKTAATETTAAVDENVIDWSQEQGATGFEGTRQEDLGIPFLSLLQKGSPEVDKTHKNHKLKKIEGAEGGMLVNTVSRQVMYEFEGKPLQFVPVFHEKLFQEWKPRTQGGGFVQSHKSPIILTRTMRNSDNQDISPNGNEIKTTSYFYGFALVEGQDPIRMIIALTSTQLKKGRGWLNMMQTIKVNGKVPPMYSHVYDVSTDVETNNDGSWFGWHFEINRMLNSNDKHLITAARSVAQECAASKLAAPTPMTEIAEHAAPTEANESAASAADEEAARQNRGARSFRR
jgi:hypothetical protein